MENLLLGGVNKDRAKCVVKRLQQSGPPTTQQQQQMEIAASSSSPALSERKVRKNSQKEVIAAKVKALEEMMSRAEGIERMHIITTRSSARKEAKHAISGRHLGKRFTSTKARRFDTSLIENLMKQRRQRMANRNGSSSNIIGQLKQQLSPRKKELKRSRSSQIMRPSMVSVNEDPATIRSSAGHILGVEKLNEEAEMNVDLAVDPNSSAKKKVGSGEFHENRDREEEGEEEEEERVSTVVFVDEVYDGNSELHQQRVRKLSSSKNPLFDIDSQAQSASAMPPAMTIEQGDSLRTILAKRRQSISRDVKILEEGQPMGKRSNRRKNRRQITSMADQGGSSSSGSSSENDSDAEDRIARQNHAHHHHHDHHDLLRASAQVPDLRQSLAPRHHK